MPAVTCLRDIAFFSAEGEGIVHAFIITTGIGRGTCPRAVARDDKPHTFEEPVVTRNMSQHCPWFFTSVNVPFVVQFTSSKMVCCRTHEFANASRHSAHCWTCRPVHRDTDSRLGYRFTLECHKWQMYYRLGYPGNARGSTWMNVKQKMGSQAEMVTFAIQLPYPSPYTPVMKQVSSCAFMVTTAQCEAVSRSRCHGALLHGTHRILLWHHQPSPNPLTQEWRPDSSRSRTCENHSSVRIAIRTSASKATVSSGFMDSGGSPPEQRENYQSRKANHRPFPVTALVFLSVSTTSVRLRTQSSSLINVTCIARNEGQKVSEVNPVISVPIMPHKEWAIKIVMLRIKTYSAATVAALLLPLPLLLHLLQWL